MGCLLRPEDFSVPCFLPDTEHCHPSLLPSLTRQDRSAATCMSETHCLVKPWQNSRFVSASTAEVGKSSTVSCHNPTLRVTTPFTESQHGRGWKGPLWVTQPNPLPKQGHPEQAAQHRGQAGLEYLQRRRLHNLHGQPGPGLCHPQSEEVLPHVQTELLVLQFVPIAPCPVTGHH